jgi:hypothetical protein
MPSTLDLDPMPTDERSAAVRLRSVGGEVKRWRRYLVAAAALAVLGSTVWQVVGKRDDWPLSSYPMYSGKQGPSTSRDVLVGVGDNAEFRLSGSQLPPVGGARLRHLNAKLASNKKRRDRFVAVIQNHYARQRQEDWPDLQAIRAYRETWRIRPGLKGINKPARTMTSSMYFPPPTLIEAMAAEESRLEPHAPVPRPEGDIVLEADASQCSSGCVDVEDRHAALGRAVELGAGAGGELAELTLNSTIGRGTWSVFVRMKVPSKGQDRLSILVDGARPKNAKKGIGNYRSALPTSSWVWASTQPGLPALSFSFKTGKQRRIVLRAGSPGVRIDQFWLSRKRRELPMFSQPLGP